MHYAFITCTILLNRYIFLYFQWFCDFVFIVMFSCWYFDFYSLYLVNVLSESSVLIKKMQKIWISLGSFKFSCCFTDFTKISAWQEKAISLLNKLIFRCRKSIPDDNLPEVVDTTLNAALSSWKPWVIDLKGWREL